MNNDDRNYNMLCSFNYLVQLIKSCKNENELRHKLKDFKDRYFKVGFGSSHLWVHQNNISSDGANVNESERILFVEF